MYNKFITSLQQQLQKSLPGQAAQVKMAHAVRSHYRPAPPSARQAAVMILFYPKNNEPYIVLTERVSTNQHDKHSGQMSFPGGAYEKEDTDFAMTATRETEEEIGVAQTSITVLGQLTDLYIPVSNFLVHPYVGYLEEAPQFNAQLSEVKHIVEVPFSILLDESTRQVKDLALSPHLTLKRVPYFNVKDKVVWGATAMILSELLEVLTDLSQVKNFEI